MKTVKSYLMERKDGKLVFERRYIANRKPRSSFGDIFDSSAVECDYFAHEYLNTLEGIQCGNTVVVATTENVIDDTDIDLRTVTYSSDFEGWSGNSNHDVKRFHGWRGTFNDSAFYAHGVRKVESVSITGNRSKKIRIVFGRDLFPDRD